MKKSVGWPNITREPSSYAEQTNRRLEPSMKPSAYEGNRVESRSS